MAIGKAHTRIIEEGNGFTRVLYHITPVVRFNGSTIILKHNGWKTATTKRRINQASCHFGLGVHVEQRQGRWYVNNREWPDDKDIRIHRKSETVTIYGRGG